MEKEQGISMIRYHSTCRLHYHVDIGSYISSGIMALDNDRNVVAQMEDISQDHRAVEELVGRLNRGRADFGQLPDFVNDFIAI